MEKLKKNLKEIVISDIDMVACKEGLRPIIFKLKKR